MFSRIHAIVAGELLAAPDRLVCAGELVVSGCESPVHRVGSQIAEALGLPLAGAGR